MCIKVCKLPAADTVVSRIKTAIASAKDALHYAQQRMNNAYNALAVTKLSKWGNSHSCHLKDFFGLQLAVRSSWLSS